MSKVKLKKKGNTTTTPGGGKVASKTFNVKDTEGNKHVLKATVFSVNKGKTNEIQNEVIDQFVMSERIVRPPLNQEELAMLQEVSSELPQNLDSMSVGIEGFGQRLIERTMTEKQKEEFAGEKVEEKNWLETLFMFPNYEGSFKELRKQTRVDLEQTGNAWWELIPGVAKNSDRYSCINKISPGQMFITKPDKNFTRVQAKYIDADFNIRTKSFSVKLRRYVQVIQSKKVFFKQFGDPRIINKKDGRVLFQSRKRYEEAEAKAKQNLEPDQYKLWLKKKGPTTWANEMYHFKLYAARRTPYGMPRYTGNLIAIKGSRSADETNIITQQNNHVPSMAIMVSGAQLTEGSIARIKEFMDTQIKGDSNYSKFLLIEAEGNYDGLGGQGSSKVEIKPLSNEQHTDQLFQEYDKNNASKLRRSFRMPGIMVGVMEDLNRATAQESERLAEKYVYNPAREAMDEILNRLLMQQGFRFWTIKSNSPNVTNDEDIVKILTGGEKTGGVTPRIAHMLLEDVLNRELPPLKEDPDFDHDIPFSLSLAKLQMSGRAEANRQGTSAPQGQNPRPRNPPGRPPSTGQTDKKMDLVENLFKKIHQSPDQVFEELNAFKDLLEDELDKDAFGEPQRDYFEHRHES